VPAYGGPEPTTHQLLLEDLDYEYDEVDNPIEIRDWRIASEWPSGAKPVSRRMEYDDLYRLSKIEYRYAGGDDAWTSPFDNEVSGGAVDPRRGNPSPHVAFDKRVLWQSFAYDWLGNTTRTEDDARGFYDRSLGAVTNDTAGGKPYQLTAATNETANPAASRQGRLTAKYDDAGYLTSMAVARRGPCLPLGAACSQRFVYDWDEVGRLARARRWDLADAGAASDPAPSRVADVELRYAYDGSDMRVLKTAVDGAGIELHTVYVFGSLELRRALFTSTGESERDYEATSWTVVPYLFAHGVRLARVVYGHEDLPSLSSGRQHVFLELPDHLGSSSIVIDKATSELVERSTYQAYGGAESDYRPERWRGFRADYRFTGKEEDVEVGLQYFGKRYLAPLLGRWISADPLNIHSPAKADANGYAYVRGAPLRSVDPLGLEDLPADTVWSFLQSAESMSLPTRYMRAIQAPRHGLRVWKTGWSATSYYGPKENIIYLKGHVFDGLRNVSMALDGEKPYGTVRLSLSDVGKLYHETAHAFMDLYQDVDRAANVRRQALEYYRNAPMTNGTVSQDPARLSEESVGVYIEDRVYTYLSARFYLESLAGSTINDPARVLRSLSEVVREYDNGMAAAGAGYEEQGGKQVHTTKPVCPAIKAFVDAELLANRFKERFVDDPDLVDLEKTTRVKAEAAAAGAPK
jgi:RHS repeat-associated protein